MSLRLEDILQMDEWTDADLASVRGALSQDSELASALDRWLQISSHVREAWDRDVPSREALVLLALADRLDETVMSDEEMALREDALSILDSARDKHPALTSILDRIRDDATAFDEAWSNGFAAAPSTSSAPDRAARPLDSESARTGQRNPSQKNSSQKYSSQKNSRLRLVRYALSTAAIVAFIAVGLNLTTTDQSSPTMTWVSEAGQWQTIQLQDGTEVRLGPDSWLEAQLTDDSFSRAVRFNGNAFFDVTESSDPFTIETEEALTTVLGTSFGVRTSNGTEVTLVTGRVSLSPIDNLSLTQILTPGQQGLVSSRSSEPTIVDVDLTRELDWVEIIVFRDTPMSDVVDSLSERFDVDIELAEDLLKTPLTGTFETDRGVKTILEIIASALGAELETAEDGTYSLTR